MVLKQSGIWLYLDTFSSTYKKVINQQYDKELDSLEPNEITFNADF